MTTTLVPVAGGRLHTIDEGNATDPAILLSHAAVAELRSWDDVVVAPLPRWS